jgi:hypothetical protein
MSTGLETTVDEPFLFHCGQRLLFPQVAGAIQRVIPMEALRWISFGHVEADECGASYSGDGAAQLRALSDGYSEMQGASLP